MCNRKLRTSTPNHVSCDWNLKFQFSVVCVVLSRIIFVSLNRKLRASTPVKIPVATGIIPVVTGIVCPSFLLCVYALNNERKLSGPPKIVWVTQNCLGLPIGLEHQSQTGLASPLPLKFDPPSLGPSYMPSSLALPLPRSGLI